VHVEGGFGGFEKYLVLCPEGRQERLLFEVDREGHLRHVQSGLNVVYNKSSTVQLLALPPSPTNAPLFFCRRNRHVPVAGGGRGQQRFAV